MYIFNELIQISLGTRDNFSVEPTYDDWIFMYEESDRQGIVGVAYEGMEKYIKLRGDLANTNINSDLLASWYSYVQKIEERNVDINRKTFWLQSWLSNQGMNSCILKGQGNAILYPNSLHRTSGDIDVWVWMKNLDSDSNSYKSSENMMQIIKWVKGKVNDKSLNFCMHHIELPPLDEIEVEAHYWPSFFFNFFTFSRFKSWCKEEHIRQMSNLQTLPNSNKQITLPTIEFNLTFQLIHILRHLYSEGIGHRHLIDYFYTLTSSDYDKEEVLRKIKLFNLTNIASAVMWIMKEIYNLPDSKLLLEPNKRLGKLLLKDMEKGGNFGHGNKEIMSKLELGKFKLFLWRTYRSYQLFRFCPSETLFSPIFRIYQYIWIKRTLNNI